MKTLLKFSIITLLILICINSCFTKIDSGQNKIEYYTIDTISRVYPTPIVLRKNNIYIPRIIH